MPDAGYPAQFAQDVPPVIEAELLDFRSTPRICELPWYQLMMIPPRSQKLLKTQLVRYENLRAWRELLLIARHGTSDLQVRVRSDQALQAGLAEIAAYRRLSRKEDISSLGENAKLEIFSRRRSHLDDSDLLIALLDGVQVDYGTAWEIGCFHARRIFHFFE